MRLRQYISEGDFGDIEDDVNAHRSHKEQLKSITEAGIKDMIKSIKKDCKPYINLLGNNDPVVRGMYQPRSIWKYNAFEFDDDTPEAVKMVVGGEYTDELSKVFGQKNVRQDRQGISNRSNMDLHSGEPGKWGAKAGTFFKALNQWLAKNGHADRSKSVSVTSDYETAAYFGQPYWVFPIGKFKYTFVPSKDFNDDSVYWSGDSMVTYLKYYEAGELDQFNAMNEFDPNRAFTTNKGFVMAIKKQYEIWIQCKQYYYIDSWQNWNRVKEWF